MVQPPPGYVPQLPSITPDSGTRTTADLASDSDASDPNGTPPTESPERPPRKFQFRQDFTAPARSPNSTATPAPRGPEPPKSVAPMTIAPEVLATPTNSHASEDSSERPRSNWMQWALIGAAAVFGIALALLFVVIAASRNQDAQDELPASTVSVANGKKPPSEAKVEKQPESNGTTASEGNAPPEKTSNPSSTPAEAPKPGTTADTAPGQSAEPTSMDTPGKGPATAEAPKPDANTLDAHTPTESPDAPPAADANAPDAAANPATAPPDTAPAADTSGLSTLIVAEANFDGVPLLDFLQFFVEFTTLPVTLDFDSLRQARIPYDAPVQLQLEATSAGDLLQTALTPAGLTYTFANGIVAIAPNTVVHGDVQSRSYDVSDLCDNAEQTIALAALITTTVEPSSWQEAGGVGVLTANDQTLEVEQSLASQFEIARLLDRLRTARGLLPRSDLPREWLTCTPVFVPMQEIFQKRYTLNFSDPTDITKVLDRIRNETEVRVLVDWAATAATDWKPHAKTTLSASDTPFAQLLDAWLEPLKLGYRVVDANLIQISSAAALKSHGEVEVYPLNDAAAKKAEALTTALQQELGEPAVKDAGGALVFEPTSHSLVVRLPQPMQRRAYAWLTSHGHLQTAK